MLKQLLKEAQVAVEQAQKAGADDAVASISDGESNEFTFRDGKLEKVQRSANRGLQIALYVDGRFSTHGTTDLRAEETERFINEAVTLTRHLEVDPDRLITDPKLYEGQAEVNLDLVDPVLETLSRETCLKWLQEMDEATHADERVISATCSVQTGRGLSARASSNGFEGTKEGTHIHYGGGVTLDEGNGKRPEAARYVGGRFLEGLPDPGCAARESLQRALRRLGSRKASSCKAVMVVDPEVGGRLIGYVLGALSAASIQQERSFLAGRLGEQVASELLTIVDDPLRPRGLRSRLWDGEGIAAKRMPLLERGVLKNYFIDTYYGRKLKWEPTTGGASNVIFEKGEKDLAGLLTQVGEGFYVNSWLGGNADGTTGDFSLGIRGHCIAGGQIGAPISEMNITGNLLELMKNLIAVGNDPTPYSPLHTPTLVFEGVQFSGK